VLLRIDLPPELLTKMFGLIADALEVIQIFGRDTLENPSKTRHRKEGKSVLSARRVQARDEIAHQFASLCFARLLISDARNEVTDVLHRES